MDAPAELCRDAKTAWQCLGKDDYGRKSTAKKNVKFRQSLSFIRDFKAGDVITEYVIRSVRFGYGLPPKFLPDISDKAVRTDACTKSLVTQECVVIDGRQP